MVENTRRNRRLLAGVVGVNMALAIAVSAGALPRPGDEGSVRTAAVSHVEEVAAPAARQPGDTATVPATATAPTAPTSAPTTAAGPRTTAPPTTKAPAPRTTQASAAPVAAKAPAAAPSAAPVRVSRTVPTAAQVQGVIGELKRQVGGLLLLVSPTPAQIDQAGDKVCTAFDTGQSFAQVKATGLSMIPASVTVSPATADWAVRQAVALYCPGHADKLV